ncbi:MAG: hypothetical protein KME40_32025 [Komarekiella atlantica HA4396-MV6]|jgi:hypothetical protein|nr:hypothetical protein [Komarekiella atlantica HA4396-MV6]
MFKQIKDLGTEKTVPENTDIIPIQESNGTTKHITRGNFLSGIGSFVNNQYIQLLDTKPDNTHGGSSVTGSWQTRVINTIQNDETAAVTLGSNSFALPSGIYRIIAQIPFEGSGRTRCRLRNITNNTDILYSSSEYFLSGSSVQSGHCFIKGQFAIAANKNLQIQYYCNASQATWGLGNATGFGSPNEIFTIIELFKVG